MYVICTRGTTNRAVLRGEGLLGSGELSSEFGCLSRLLDMKKRDWPSQTLKVLPTCSFGKKYLLVDKKTKSRNIIEEKRGKRN
ncbi:hypothetical protein ACSS6W_007072 [Trichoderma asperelloides]